jgi:hypothetical protein
VRYESTLFALQLFIYPNEIYSYWKNELLLFVYEEDSNRTDCAIRRHGFSYSFGALSGVLKVYRYLLLL